MTFRNCEFWVSAHFFIHTELCVMDLPQEIMCRIHEIDFLKSGTQTGSARLNPVSVSEPRGTVLAV